MPTLPSLPSASSVLGTDIFWDVKGTASYKATGTQIKDFSVNAISTTYAALLALQVGSTLVSGYRYFISLPIVTWNVAVTYNLNDEVNDGAGNYYKSKAGSNTGNLVTDTTWWKQVYRGITLVANDVDALDMHAEINISGSTDFILFDFVNDNVLAYSADIINTSETLLYSDTSTVGTDADTLEKTLATYPLLANTLGVDGDIIEIRASGTFFADANNKQLRIKIGTTTILDTNAAPENDFAWSIYVQITRTAAATQDVYFMASETDTSVAGWATNKTYQGNTTSAEDLTTDLDLELTGQNGVAVANDIVKENYNVRHIKS